MFMLRRAAVRAIAQSSIRVAPTATRIVPLQPLQSSKPTIYRSLHQTRIWHAEADQIKDETTAAAETAQEAAEAATQAADDAIVEAAASEAPESSPAVQEAQEVAEGESSIAAEAAETAAAAASTATSTGPPEPPQRSSAREDRQSTNFASPPPSRILYIGNLFFEVTAANLEAEFGRYGTISNSRIVTDARGLSKGFGYVEFTEQADADQAVRELDQKVFQGRRMAVQYHVKRERSARSSSGPYVAQNPPSKTLFIGNMSYQMSDRDLNDLFREIRDVLDVRVAIDRRSGQPRGFAHADFIDTASAEKAKAVLEQKVVYGRQLRVDFSLSNAAKQAGQV